MKSTWFRPPKGFQQPNSDFKLDKIKKALDQGIDLNVLDEEKYTPLQMVIRGSDDRNKINLIKMLIEAKADVNLARDNSTLPLSMAACSSHSRLTFVQAIMAAKDQAYWRSQLPLLDSVLSDFLQSLVTSYNTYPPLVPITDFEQEREKLFVLAELFKTDKDGLLERSKYTFDRFVQHFEQPDCSYVGGIYNYTYLAFFGYLFLDGIIFPRLIPLFFKSLL